MQGYGRYGGRTPLSAGIAGGLIGGITGFIGARRQKRLDRRAEEREDQLMQMRVDEANRRVFEADQDRTRQQNESAATAAERAIEQFPDAGQDLTRLATRLRQPNTILAEQDRPAITLPADQQGPVSPAQVNPAATYARLQSRTPQQKAEDDLRFKTNLETEQQKTLIGARGDEARKTGELTAAGRAEVERIRAGARSYKDETDFVMDLTKAYIANGGNPELLNSFITGQVAFRRSLGAGASPVEQPEAVNDNPVRPPIDLNLGPDTLDLGSRFPGIGGSPAPTMAGSAPTMGRPLATPPSPPQYFPSGTTGAARIRQMDSATALNSTRGEALVTDSETRRMLAESRIPLTEANTRLADSRRKAIDQKLPAELNILRARPGLMDAQRAAWTASAALGSDRLSLDQQEFVWKQGVDRFRAWHDEQKLLLDRKTSGGGAGMNVNERALYEQFKHTLGKAEDYEKRAYETTDPKERKKFLDYVGYLYQGVEDLKRQIGQARTGSAPARAPSGWDASKPAAPGLPVMPPLPLPRGVAPRGAVPRGPAPTPSRSSDRSRSAPSTPLVMTPRGNYYQSLRRQGATPAEAEQLANQKYPRR